MFFSASQLCKSSAAQIKFMRDKPRPPATINMEAGDRFADLHSKSPMKEMSGRFFHKNLAIWFSVDELEQQGNILRAIEHKSVREDEQWYFRNCLIQCAFYGALLQHVPALSTAKYYKGEEYYVNLAPFQKEGKILSFLNYGGVRYRVYGDAVPIIRFFLTKARASLNSYDVAKRFDKTFSKNEWEYFKKCIKYRKA